MHESHIDMPYSFMYYHKQVQISFNSDVAKDAVCEYSWQQDIPFALLSCITFA